jgi:hypothetical protein
MKTFMPVQASSGESWFTTVLKVALVAALPYIALVILQSGMLPILISERMVQALEANGIWWAAAVVLLAIQPRSKL